jgi:hypothetical protein
MTKFHNTDSGRSLLSRPNAALNLSITSDAVILLREMVAFSKFSALRGTKTLSDAKLIEVVRMHDNLDNVLDRAEGNEGWYCITCSLKQLVSFITVTEHALDSVGSNGPAVASVFPERANISKVHGLLIGIAESVVTGQSTTSDDAMPDPGDFVFDADPETVALLNVPLPPKGGH